MNSATTRKRDLRIGLLSLVCILFFIFGTNPAALPAVFLLALPIFSGMFVWSAMRLLLGVFLPLSQRHTDTISLLIGVGFMIILALGSIHQLGVQDVVLTILLLSGLLFYCLGTVPQETQASSR